ncbi:hypothetical protein QBC47DRAFT_379871 [Echria macrotheca]|uniref:Uncharacterized protein n=1 Tax=Echria macrotheca TaxID=438768 RepID=A0AAJ0BGI2_9PEZI|nr:hypothetical protein QBC47DRAFT_379871 [Echria macrotheca]
MPFLSIITSLAIAALSLFTLQNATRSVPKLQKYESKAEKAAKWSSAADKRLKDTRRTVTAGIVMTSLSLLSSLYLLVYGSGKILSVQFVWALAMAVCELRTAEYIRSFWDGERKVPLLEDYNAAIGDMAVVKDMSVALGSCWGVMVLLRVFGY